MTAPLMPKATAVWLVDNTTLTFRQIAKFCEIHELEIQAIADGDIAYNIIGVNPVNNGQLSWEEIHRCEADKTADLVANVMEKNVKELNAKAKKILSPSQRSDKPATILWILKHCPEIMDSQICKLIGTTKPTISKIRNGEYADIANLKPKNPVAVGLCSEKDLEAALEISKAHTAAKQQKKTAKKSAAKKKTSAKKPATKKTATTAAKKTAKAAVKKTETKKAPAKKESTKKAAAKKPAAKKTAVKKSSAKATAKKPAEKKTAVKKASAQTAEKKSAAKKAAPKKTAAKKTTAKKTATKKTAAAKGTAKKSASRKSAAKK